jgi:glycosyltransferase involved in cell wall biosynthesis
MTSRILFIERKPFGVGSIERVFRQVAKDLPPGEFEIDFQSLPYGYSALDVAKNLLLFRPRKADIYHVTGHVNYICLRLPRGSTVLTLHDFVLLHIRSGLRRSILKKLFFDWPLRRMRFLTAVSEQTRQEASDACGVSPDLVTVIENPLLDGFDPHPEKAFDEHCPRVLHIGTAPNKNLGNLAEALRGLPCTLRVIGKVDTPTQHTFEAANLSYESVADLDQVAIEAEYRNCDVVSFCTSYEGFGLPIIEAQAMRKPVITSDREPMRSVAGKGAILVDPDDPSNMRKGFQKMFSDAALRTSLIEAGSTNVARYDPQIAASKYADLYRGMIASWRTPS